MDYLIISTEVLTLSALVLFAGVLDSKYYERKPIKYLDWLTWGLLGIGITIMMLPVDGDINRFNMRLVWHLFMVATICYCLYKFPKIELKYDKQFYIACFFLFLTIVLEVLAIVVNGIKHF